MRTSELEARGLDLSHRKWPIIEIFGPTIQGEGAMAGKPTMFVRFGGCGYRCSWCDTMYAVDPQQVKENRTMMSAGDIIDRLIGRNSVRWVTFSGGDPCLQPHLEPLIIGLRSGLSQKLIAVETQGEFFPEWLKMVDQITFSPKPPSSGMDDRLNIRELSAWMSHHEKFRPYQNQCLKFVIQTQDDLDWVYTKFLQESVFDTIPVYLQPCSPPQVTSNMHVAEQSAMDVVDRLALLTEWVLERHKERAERWGYDTRYLNRKAGLHIGVQLHRLMFPYNEKGV